MIDRLPIISIKIHSKPLDYLKAIQTIANNLGNYAPTLHERLDILPGYHMLVIRPLWETPHHELDGQMIAKPKIEDRVFLEVRARIWAERHPSYVTYKQTAEDIFQPLVREYNKVHKLKLRLSIQSQESTEPKLPKDASIKFDRFIGLANKSVLSAQDWRYFYAFIRHCHRHAMKVDTDDIFRLLVHNGFDEEYADRIALIFEHGIDLLKVPYRPL